MILALFRLAAFAAIAVSLGINLELTPVSGRAEFIWMIATLPLFFVLAMPRRSASYALGTAIGYAMVHIPLAFFQITAFLFAVNPKDAAVIVIHLVVLTILAMV